MLKLVLVSNTPVKDGVPIEQTAVDGIGVPVIPQDLKAGDAWLVVDDLPAGQAVIVERKTLPDFLMSIADERLFNQCAAMRELSPWCYVVVTEWPVVVEGKVYADDRLSNWDWPRIQGALLTVQDLGVSVVFGWKSGDYPAMLKALACRSHATIHLKPRRNAVPMTREEQILASLPGIADGRAHALLAKCGTVMESLTYLTTGNWNGVEVPGVRPNNQAVRSALGIRDGFSAWQIPDADSRELEK